MRIWNPCGFVLLGLFIGLCILLSTFFIRKAWSQEVPQCPELRSTLSNSYDALEEERSKLEGFIQTIEGIQKTLGAAARNYDKAKKD